MVRGKTGKGLSRSSGWQTLSKILFFSRCKAVEGNCFMGFFTFTFSLEHLFSKASDSQR